MCHRSNSGHSHAEERDGTVDVQRNCAQGCTRMGGGPQAAETGCQCRGMKVTERSLRANSHSEYMVTENFWERERMRL